MEITKREVIASITIIAFWLCLGFLVSGKIDAWQQDNNAEYDRAARITEPEMFQHGMNTNLGNAFVYGDLVAQEPVTYPEIGGNYSYIQKVKERYTKHTRTVTKTRTNSKGETETYTEEEIYWTWDEVDRESRKAKEFDFLGECFEADKFTLPLPDYLECIKESYYVRYKYYGVPDQMTGTIYTKLANGTIQGKSKFYEMTIEETSEMLEKKGLTILFWILWIISMIGLVYGFYYLDNNWLNK